MVIPLEISQHSILACIVAKHEAVNRLPARWYELACSDDWLHA